MRPFPFRVLGLIWLLVATQAATAVADGAQPHWLVPATPGALVICGGGRLPDLVLDEFIRLAGGPQARLIVIPTASSYADGDDAPARFTGPWKTYGLASVSILHTRDRDQANDREFVKRLQSATAVWFSGGQQSRLTEAYVGTRVETALYDLLKRGGVVGGTSAGAAIQSQTMIAWGSPPQATVSRGFDLLPGMVIDQHFSRRRRKSRLLAVLAAHPGLVGIGIDENTALVARGDQLTVLGQSKVTVCWGGTQNRDAQTRSLNAGTRICLQRLLQAVLGPPSTTSQPTRPSSR